MRLKPQVERSSGIEITENLEILGKHYRKDTPLYINIWNLHNDPTQWHTPTEYIPDRFDPKSKFYLTPAGAKRHPMSFGPFLGGKRICLGKTFAEKLVKSMIPIIISQLEFEFCDPELNTNMPASMIFLQAPFDVKVKVLA
jgi:cytochrome P450